MMDAKVKNLNTTFLHGTVANPQLLNIFHNPYTYFKYQGLFYTNDPRSSLNPKIQTKPKSLKVTICFYELML